MSASPSVLLYQKHRIAARPGAKAGCSLGHPTFSFPPHALHGQSSHPTHGRSIPPIQFDTGHDSPLFVPGHQICRMVIDLMGLTGNGTDGVLVLNHPTWIPVVIGSLEPDRPAFDGPICFDKYRVAHEALPQGVICHRCEIQSIPDSLMSPTRPSLRA